MTDAHCTSSRSESSKPRHTPRALLMFVAPITLVALASLAGTQRSHAETAAAIATSDTSAPALEEITVTARYKSENLQQAPIAISVLTAADIQARGYLDAADVANSAPNVEMQQNNGVFGRATTAYIRGVGQFDFNYALEPGVAFYLDGVYLGTLVSNNIALMDVDNVQVLRGPQGTLSGKNSEGGTISIATVKPKGDGTGYLEAGIGEFSRLTFKGAFDTSLIDNQLFVRVSAASDRYDGYQKRIDYVCANPAQSGTLQPVATAPNCQVGTLGGDSLQTVRVALRWLPASNLEINLSADRSDDKGDATPSTQLALFAPIATGTLGSYGLNPNAFIGSSHPYLTYAGFHDVGTGRFIPAVDNSQSWGTAGTIDWDAADGIHVKSITGYRWYGMDWGGQQGGAPVLLAGPYNTVEHNQTSQELQISGHALDNALDWTGGGYYYHGSSTNGGFVDVAFAGFGFSQNNSAKVTDKSAFLHVDYKVGNFGVEAGLRYTKEDKTVDIDELVLPVSQGIPFVPLNSTSESLSRSDPKIGVRYQFTPEVMAYLQYSTGFKAGGANPRPTSPATTGIPFGAEIVKAYEAGLKTEWLNHTLRSNTALFVSNYDDFQATGTVPSSNFILVVETNIGKARIYGAEEEIQYEPVQDLQFNLNTGWLHWKTLNLGDSANCNCGGPTLTSKPQGVPEFTINAGAQYTFGMGPGGKLTPRLDYTYKAMVWNDAPNTPGNSTPGVGLLDAHLTWSPATHEDWSVIGTVSNVTNKFYYTNTLLQPWSLDGVPSPPRMWAVHVRKRF